MQPHLCPSGADSLPLFPAVAKSPFGRSNNKSHYCKQSDWGNIQHEDKSMKSIWLLSLKMPKCQRVQKSSISQCPIKFFVTFPGNFLRYVNVFQQSDLNKCHSWVKQQLVRHFSLFSTFYLVSLKFFWEKNSFLSVPATVRTKKCMHTYDQSWMSMVLMWDITPSPRSTTFSLRVVAPNS